MSKKKKSILTTALAVTLATAMLIGGGTFAYLQGETDEVVNEFATNQVEVDLWETDENGEHITSNDDYNIIPGTSEKKNPTVTVTASVDAYVFLVVTDNTYGLVDYTIDTDVWTQLKIDGVNVDGVYYCTVAAGTTDKDLNVLVDQTVSYPADKTNADMEDSEEVVTLSFKAYIIQKINGNADEDDEDESDYTYFTPSEAYYQVRYGKEAETVSSQSEITTALTSGDVAVLTGDVTVNSSFYNTMSKLTGENVIDLNGYTLTSTDNDYLLIKGDTTITNGTIDYNGLKSSSTPALRVYTDSTLTLDNVDINTNGVAVSAYGSSSTSSTAEINIIRSTITSSGGYCVATSAANADDITMNITDSNLYSTDDYYGSAAVLFNVPGTLTIDNCYLSSARSTVIVRGGTANISNSKIVTFGNRYALEEMDGANGVDNLYEETWLTGAGVPQGSLVLGTKGSSYQYPTICTLTNVELTTYDTGRTIYAYGSGSNTVTLTYDDASDVGTEGQISYNGDVTVNGESK